MFPITALGWNAHRCTLTVDAAGRCPGTVTPDGQGRYGEAYAYFPVTMQIVFLLKTVVKHLQLWQNAAARLLTWTIALQFNIDFLAYSEILNWFSPLEHSQTGAQYMTPYSKLHSPVLKPKPPHCPKTKNTFLKLCFQPVAFVKLLGAIV